MGKPTHVFDLDLLEGGKIIVRRARDGEKLKTLDGVERKLTAEDLVVADAVKPVGLAGTMGGFDTMITDKTRNILIESAWWDPVTVRKMARRHGLHTDASHRFERGADFESTILSCDRVAELILQSGGGELVGDPVDVVARWLDQAPVGLRMAEVHRILGDSLDTNQVVRILQRLGFEVLPEPEQEPEFTVRIPSWRLDIEREIDLIEEIARLHGYDKFENTLPSFSGSVIETPDAAKDQKLRSSLLALGYDEAVSLTFISHDDARDFCAVPVIEIANPLSDEASVMRTSLVPGMLNMLAYNLNRGNDNVRLFEAGSVFESGKRGCGGTEADLHGSQRQRRPAPASINRHGRSLSSTLKGDVETLLHLLQHDVLAFDAQTAEYYHPGRSARAVMDGATVAQFGQLHPGDGRQAKVQAGCVHRRVLPGPAIPARSARSAFPGLAAVSRSGAGFLVRFRGYRSLRSNRQGSVCTAFGRTAQLCSGRDFSRRSGAGRQLFGSAASHVPIQRAHPARGRSGTLVGAGG